jgi:hypothetical protein
MEDGKGDLTTPLLTEMETYDKDAKKLVSRRAHENPFDETKSDEDEVTVKRRRVISYSACTDPHEFNDKVKMDPQVYYYLNLWGQNLEDSDDEEDDYIKNEFLPAEDMMKL